MNTKKYKPSVLKREQLKAKNAYNNLPAKAKELVKYFCNSLKVEGYVLPDGFYFTKDPKTFTENMKEAERIVRTAPLDALFLTIEVCHRRRHEFWGKVPMFKIKTLIKAYNSLLGDGTVKLNSKKEKNETTYGGKRKTF